VFTLENLNDKKNGFDYGTLKIGNLADDITMKHLENQKFNFTSSEMLYLYETYHLHRSIETDKARPTFKL
jgi:hypothetical protein